MRKINFGLVGAGGFAREIMPLVRGSLSRTLNCRPDDVGLYFVETWEPEQVKVNDYPLISLAKFLELPGERYFSVAVADGRVRAKLVSAVGCGATPVPISSPSAVFLDANKIGDGAIFCANTVVTSNVEIGRYFHANVYSCIGHDCVIGDFVTFAPGVRCNGRVHVGDHAYIGTNAILREGRHGAPTIIGAGAIVGMGAVVTKDVPAGVTVIGNPARVMAK